MKDLTVTLENRPGTLAGLGEALGKAEINIEGASGDNRLAETLHVLVEDGAAAREALSRAGIEVTDERDVLVVGVEDRPGTLGELTRKLADAGVNVDLIYATFGDVKVVLGVDDPDKARSAL
jgi:hypothetical protein